MLRIASLLAGAGVVLASCPNSCSGKRHYTQNARSYNLAYFSFPSIQETVFALAMTFVFATLTGRALIALSVLAHTVIVGLWISRTLTLTRSALVPVCVTGKSIST